MIYLELFFVFAQIGILAFGGGYAAMPLIQSLVLEKHGWITVEEFADLTAIAEMTPGPIIVNSATFVGQKLAGFLGAVCCTVGAILPSFAVVLVLSVLYMKYRNLKLMKGVLAELRPAVAAMITGAALTLLLLALFGSASLGGISFGNIKPVEVILFVIALVLLRKKKAGPIQIIFGTAFAGTLLYFAAGFLTSL